MNLNSGELYKSDENGEKTMAGRKKMKRFLAILAAGTMLCSGFPVNLGMDAYAAETAQAEALTAAFASEYAQVGEALSVNVTGASDVTYQWYVDGKRVATTAAYTPVEADLEKWIEVIVTTADGEEEASAKLYCSKLPVVYIDTENGVKITSKEDYVDATMKIQGNDTYNSENTTLYDGVIEIRGRGNSTWSMPKKPYKIKLDKKTDVFGMGKNKHWVLLANYSDESLMRNTLAYNFSGSLGMEQMSTVWVDVVLNGEYVGNYQFCEQVRVDGTRVDVFDWESFAEDSAAVIAEAEGLDKDTTGDLETYMLEEDMSWITSGVVNFGGTTYKISDYPDIEVPSINGGYILELDEYYDEVSKFKTWNGQPIMFKNPEFVYTNDDMMEFVQTYVQAFEDAVQSGSYTAQYEGKDTHYSELYDFDSLVDYWLISEIFFNEEINKKSTYMYKEIDELMKMGPIWDMDYSSGGEGQTYHTEQWATIYYKTNAQAEQWYKYLIQDPYFVTRAQERYWEIRNNQVAAMVNSIDAHYDLLLESANADTEVWPTGESSYRRNTFTTEVTNLKKWFTDHLAWMDEQMATEDSLAASLYYKGEKELQLVLTDSQGKALESDTAAKAPADGLVADGAGVKLTITGSDYVTGAAAIYVNGKKLDNTVHVGTEAVTVDIPASALTASTGEKDVIEVKVEDWGVYAANYVTVKEGEKAPIEYPNDLDFLTYCDNDTLKTWVDPVWGITDAQEQEIKAFVEQNIVTDEMNDYQKAEAIYVWITENVRYADASEVISANPYDVFKNEVAVCGGFSNLYKAMLNLVDIPAVVLVGNTSAGAHAWNAVYADDRWFYADTTWGTADGLAWYDTAFDDFNQMHETVRVEAATVEVEDVLLGYDGGIAVVGVADGVKNATVPETYEDIKIEKISYQLFNQDYGLEELNIGKNIQRIDTQQASKTLQAVNVSKENTVYASKDGVLFTKDMKSIIIYPAAKTDEAFVIPKETDSLNLKDTFGNKYLKELEVEAGNTAYAAEAGLLYNKDKTTLLYVPAAQEKVEILVNASIDEMAFVNADKSKITIYAETNSPAHQYAVANNIAFVSTSECKHTKTEVKNAKAATCTETGYTGDTYCADECKELLESGSVIEKLAHSYGAWVTTKEATCMEAGSKERTCTCGHTETEAIAKLAHKWASDYTIDKEATCTEAGSKSKHCTTEGCTEKTDVTAIAKLDHVYGDWVIVKNPTVAGEGLKEKACTGCGTKVQEVIEKLPQVSVPEELDKTSAQQYYDACLAYYVEEDYSEESWAVYVTAMDALKAALENEEVTVEELQEAIDAVSAATNALEEKPVEKPVEPDTERPSSPVTGDANAIMVYSMILLVAAAIILSKNSLLNK